MLDCHCKVCPLAVNSDVVQNVVDCFENGDYTQAFEPAMPLAESGNVLAQNMVGSFFQTGIGTQSDDLKAEKWLESAGQQGCGLAWHNLAALYLSGGKNLLPNQEKARECLDKAIINGFDLALTKDQRQ